MSELIGKKIANRLRDQGKTQEWLAEIAKVSINAVSKWTKTGKISRANLPVVAAALGMSLDELFTEAPVEVKPISDSKLERLDAEEADLIEKFRQCTVPQRRVIKDHIDILLRPSAALRKPSSVRNKP